MQTSSFLNTCTLAICLQVHVHCTVWLLSYFWSALWLIIIEKKKTLIITTTNQNKGKIKCLGCGKMLHNDLVAIGFSSASDWLRIAGVIWRNLRAYRAEGKTTAILDYFQPYPTHLSSGYTFWTYHLKGLHFNFLRSASRLWMLLKEMEEQKS